MHRAPGTHEQEEGSATDVFRRAALQWALVSKNLLAAGEALTSSQKVSLPALKDIEHGLRLLKKLELPHATRTPEDTSPAITTAEFRRVVSDVRRVLSVPKTIIEPPERMKESVFAALRGGAEVTLESRDELGNVTMTVSEPTKPKKVSGSKTVDLNAPVVSKNGKSEWAKIFCPECPAGPTERCKRADGLPREKPHPSRKES